MNLLQETLDILSTYDKTPDDVLWCGAHSFGWFHWSTFKQLADVEYDNGYGAPYVATDLVIVGKDFWLERDEYDGAEVWYFMQLPDRPTLHKIPQVLTTAEAKKIGADVSCGWNELGRMHRI